MTGKTTTPPTAVRWYTAEQVADALQLHVETVRRLVRDGTIPAQHFGRSVRISSEVLDQYGQASPGGTS